MIIRLSLQAFSSDLFMILGLFFLIYYEFNLKAQLEGAAEPYRLFIYLFTYYFPTIKITQALHYTKMWRGDLRKPQGLYEEAPSLQ